MSRRSLPAVYENGVFRPLLPIDLQEHQRVTLVFTESPDVTEDEELLDLAFVDSCIAEADDSVTLESVCAALSRIPGSMTADFVAERDERVGDRLLS
jgi:predicted DNA-binding antitoxin AbrB/MazE fold protein